MKLIDQCVIPNDDLPNPELDRYEDYDYDE